MEQFQALAKETDPAKVEATIKQHWARIDTKGEGSVTAATFAEAGKRMQKFFNRNEEPTEEKKARYKQLLDPDNTGVITYENFAKFVQAGLTKMREQGGL